MIVTLQAGRPSTATSGGLVYFTNAAGAVLARAKPKPVDPASQASIQARRTLCTLSGRWSTSLSSGQRAAWSTYAAATPTPVRSGTKILQGSQQYYRSNRPRLIAGQPPIDDAPTTPGIPTAPSCDVYFGQDLNQAACTFDPSQIWATTDGATLYLYFGVGRSIGRQSKAEVYYFAAAIPGGSSLPPRPVFVNSRTSGVVAGNLVWWRCSAGYPDGTLSI